MYDAQKLNEKVADRYSFLPKYYTNQIKTREMCEKATDKYPSISKVLS